MFSDLLRKLDVNMRAFIVLGFLLAAANAASLGYQYGPGIQSSTVESYGPGSSSLIGSGSSLVGTSGGRVVSSGIGSVGLGGGLGGGSYSSSRRVVSTGGLSGGSLIGSGSLGGGLVSTTGYGSGNLVGSGSIGGRVISSGNYGSGGLVSSGNIGSGLIGGGSVGGGLVSSGSYGNYGGRTTIINPSVLDNVPQTVELTKQYFHFAAPDEQVNEGAITRQLSNVLKKNLQVVFIKAPENNAATSAALQLAKQAIEQRTAIYVLSKEQDGNQLIGQLQQIQESVPTSPEVKFIKYRTAEDIAHAKDVIQSQYEQLGGSSQVINGGIAPVLNYASQSTGGNYAVDSGLAYNAGVSGGSSLGSYNSGSLLGSGSGSYGSGAILSGGASHGTTLLSSGSGLGGGAILSGSGLSGGLSSGLSSGLGGGAVLSSGNLGGIGSSKTVVTKVVESSSPVVSQESSVEYLPPFKK